MTGPKYHSRPTSSGTYTPVAEDWRDRAACGSATLKEQQILTGGDAGYRGANAPYYRSAAKAVARKFCDHCPVRVQCYNWASSEPMFMGIAGGMLLGFEAGKHYRADHRRIIKL